jgi:hypothetical protein
MPTHGESRYRAAATSAQHACALSPPSHCARELEVELLVITDRHHLEHSFTEEASSDEIFYMTDMRSGGRAVRRQNG